MKFLSQLLEFVLNPSEFLYQRERRKYRETLARGEKPKMPVLDFSGGGKVRVDVRDIVATENFRKQCEAVERIRIAQTTSRGS